MQGSIGSWDVPTPRAAWWRRRVEAKRGMVMMAVVAVVAFGAILALDTIGVRVSPPAAVMLSSAGGG